MEGAGCDLGAQGGLAGAGLDRDEADVALAGAGLVEEGLELGQLSFARDKNLLGQRPPSCGRSAASFKHHAR